MFFVFFNWNKTVKFLLIFFSFLSKMGYKVSKWCDVLVNIDYEIGRVFLCRFIPSYTDFLTFKKKDIKIVIFLYIMMIAINLNMYYIITILYKGREALMCNIMKRNIVITEAITRSLFHKVYLIIFSNRLIYYQISQYYLKSLYWYLLYI